ncbi:MAG: hypothetical protein VKP62_11750 [Candidatus Sericytochromatia bacterium]|nr:hypothetical protein [Candidatus Sericytochromatia bacterium]
MRNRVGEVASRYWSADTPAALRQLQQWVHPSMVEAQLARWPEGAQRRDGRVELITPPAFVHVVEGAPSGDRLIARLEARIAQDFFDAQGRCIRTERHPPEFSYHHWRHIDGQGWQLEGITAHFPRGEAPPSSVACGLAAVAQEDA